MNAGAPLAGPRAGDSEAQPHLKLVISLPTDSSSPSSPSSLYCDSCCTGPCPSSASSSCYVRTGVLSPHEWKVNAVDTPVSSVLTPATEGSDTEEGFPALHLPPALKLEISPPTPQSTVASATEFTDSGCCGQFPYSTAESRIGDVEDALPSGYVSVAAVKALPIPLGTLAEQAPYFQAGHPAVVMSGGAWGPATPVGSTGGLLARPRQQDPHVEEQRRRRLVQEEWEPHAEPAEEDVFMVCLRFRDEARFSFALCTSFDLEARTGGRSIQQPAVRAVLASPAHHVTCPSVPALAD